MYASRKGSAMKHYIMHEKTPSRSPHNALHSPSNYRSRNLICHYPFWVIGASAASPTLVVKTDIYMYIYVYICIYGMCVFAIFPHGSHEVPGESRIRWVELMSVTYVVMTYEAVLL